jgi:hypothetical protein
MEKIERFLRQYSWLLKLGIAFLFLFWVLQFGQLILWSNRPSEVPQVDVSLIQHSEEAEKELYFKLRAQMEEVSKKIISEAWKKAKRNEHDTGYTPADYFEDIKKIRMENTKIYNKIIVMGINSPEKQLLDLLRRNQMIDKDFGQKFDISQKKYKNWLKETHYLKSRTDYDLLEQGSKKEDVDWGKVLVAFLDWLTKAYWRGILPILLLYLIRMEERKGILQTVLADKKKFFLSALAWPIFFWKYPFNVVKEILVETEIRRTGSIFRKLSRSERKKIIHVAENFSFRVWVKSFRQRNASKLQYAFLTALIVTVFMHFVLPVASAQNKTKKSSSYQQQMQEKGEHQKNDKSPTHPDSGNHDDAEFTPPYIPEEPIISRLIVQEIITKEKERLDEILCVPCEGCLVKNTKQPEQSFLRHNRRKSWTWKRLYKKLYNRLLRSLLSAISNMKFHPTYRLKNHRWLKIYS